MKEIPLSHFYPWEKIKDEFVINMMRDPKKGSAVKPTMFNPFRRKKQKIQKAPISVLKDIFVR